MARKKMDVSEKSIEHVCLTGDNKEWLENLKFGEAKTSNAKFTKLREFYTKLINLKKNGAKSDKGS